MSRLFDITSRPPTQSQLVSPVSPVYSLMSAVTLSAWVFIPSPTWTNFVALQAVDPVTPAGPIIGGTSGFTFEIINNSGVQLISEIISSQGHLSLSESTPGLLSLDSWAHVAMTFDFSDSLHVTHIYINGIESTYAAQLNNFGANDTPSTGNIFVIGSDGFPFDVFPGYIAEASAWNRSLSLSEIAQLAVSSSGVPQNIPNLVGYWHLCGQISPEPDASGNGNSLVVLGNALPGPSSPGFTCGTPEIPVKIVQEPLGQSVSVGQTATFSVSVSGGQNVSYQWRTTNHRLSLASGFNPLPGAEVDGFWDIVGATSSSYTTPALQLSDNGTQFVCAIKSQNPVPQSVGRLNIFGAYQAFTTPQQLVSQLSTQPVVLTVH